MIPWPELWPHIDRAQQVANGTRETVIVYWHRTGGGHDIVWKTPDLNAALKVLREAHCADEYKGLIAVPPNNVEEKWQPIETAPRDGTRVLLFVPPYGPSTGHYRLHNWGDGASNWYAHSVLNKEAEPTHWMPLPDPPETNND